LRIAIANSFAGQEVAETGLSRRIYRAAINLGWEAQEVSSSSTEIDNFDPDFVIALHFFTPKLTRHPTYGCMWNPPAFFEREEGYVKNILGYDSYLTSSEYISDWLRDKLRDTDKKYFLAPFYTSCHQVPYRPPDLSRPRLLYAGTNWDGPRYKKLFQKLDSEAYTDIYGGASAWAYLKHAYKGKLPFDGQSILAALNRAGAGLCLHKEEHRRAATPSLRIFEIAASGAIAICQEHPFIREAFGDSVLYLSESRSVRETVRQISEYMRWITLHREEALAMSRRAYDIFAESYSLEGLLSGIVPHHQRLIAEKGFVADPLKQHQDGYEATCEVYGKRSMNDERFGLIRRVVRKLRLT
jgi:Glycosyl transferases group 1